MQIRVRVFTSSPRKSISRGLTDTLTVRLTSAPIEGKANKELLRLLAKALNVPPSRLVILSGEKSRDKVILVRDLSLEAATELVERL